jgi:arylsulfatase A-like enzyme
MRSRCSGQDNSSISLHSGHIDQPNIVLILADDVALMDFGAYGGEAQTPNIDKLASNGSMLTNFHTSPMCAPSRKILLIGMDSHRTGVPNLPFFYRQNTKPSQAMRGFWTIM